MKDVLDAWWRALADWLHPVVALHALLPVGLAGGGTFVLGWFFWEDAVAAVRAALEEWELVATVVAWLGSMGAGAWRTVIAPLVIVALALPVLVLLSLLLVAWLMAPPLVRRVATRRFPALLACGLATRAWRAIPSSLGYAMLALLALLVTLPLWLVPGLGVVLPALIAGWAAANVLAHASLFRVASASERHRITHTVRWPLLGMGLVTGLAAALPSLAVVLGGAASLIFAPLAVVAAVVVYTGVFAFSTLWFAHFTLARLHLMRAAALSSGAPVGSRPLPLPDFGPAP